MFSLVQGYYTGRYRSITVEKAFAAIVGALI